MYVILAAGFFSLIPPVYFIRLMADARKLKQRLPGRPVAGVGFSSDVESGEAPIADCGGPAAVLD